MTALAITEGQLLADLELVVERGLATFVEVGQALMEIRDGRLYRESHGTFDDYCRDRWSMERAHAYRLIQSAEVASALSPMGDTPRNERQARELAPLLDQPEKLRDAWAEASADGEPTALRVREAVEQRRPTLTVPIDEDLLQRQQRETLIQQLDRAVYSLESPPSAAEAQARRLLAEGDPGPFTPSRFDRVAEYAAAFARTLREAGVVPTPRMREHDWIAVDSRHEVKVREHVAKRDRERDAIRGIVERLRLHGGDPTTIEACPDLFDAAESEAA